MKNQNCSAVTWTIIVTVLVALAIGAYVYGKSTFALGSEVETLFPNIVSRTTKVSDINQYTDSDFGFSFWYPSGWMVTQVPVKNSQKYQGGTVTKQLDILNGRSLVTVEEFTSPTLSITDSTGVGACPVCVTTHYYFNSSRQTWMVEFPDGTPSGLYSGNPYTAGNPAIANTSFNTMGGLHMFAGSDRFGANVIIPLTTSNFLVVTVDGGIATESSDPQALAKTIVALDTSLATPVSALEQAQTVGSEAKAYDVSGK